MISIPTLFFGAKDRRLRRWPAGLWLGAALVLAAAAGSFAGVTGGSDEASLHEAAVPSEAAASEPSKTPTSSVADAIAEPETVSASATSSRPGGEQQRRVFMLLLLNSAGPLRPYSGLSR